jgi:hypothetical protein
MDLDLSNLIWTVLSMPQIIGVIKPIFPEL